MKVPALYVDARTIIHQEGSRTHIVEIKYGETVLVNGVATCNRDEDMPSLQSVAEGTVERLFDLAKTAESLLVSAGIIPTELPSE